MQWPARRVLGGQTFVVQGRESRDEQTINVTPVQDQL